MKNESAKKVFGGAFIIALGGFLTKILGAFYRVPLANLLGETGLGLYQTAFPAYACLIDISSAGVPNAMAKLVSAEPENGRNYLRESLKLFGIFGLIASGLLVVLGRPLSAFQGNPDAYFCYYFLAPAVAFCSILACFRGYFQGRLKMLPTAVSQIIEQGVKFAVGIILLKTFSLVTEKVAGATVAVTISEAVAVAFIILFYFFSKKPQVKPIEKGLKTKLLSYALPITLLSVIFPLSQVTDSALIIRILSGYVDNSREIYGVYSGCALAVVNLPVSVCYGLAAVAVPVVSAKTSFGKIKGENALIVSTLILSVLGGICCVILSPVAVKLLFPSLKAEYKTLTVGLIRALSPSVVGLSLLQTTNSVLIGKGRTAVAIITSFTAVAVKTALAFFLLKIEVLGIYGIVLSVNLCYLLAVFFNIMYIEIYGNKKRKNREYNDG